MTDVMIGADPEFFLYDTKRGYHVSAHDIVPGTKDKPSPLPDGSFIQADGTAVEFNIQPAKSGKEFKEKIRSALNEIRKIIPAEYTFRFEPFIQYHPIIWRNIPEKSKELGCDPDFKGVFGQVRLNTIRGSEMNLIRTGSGHIHIGWTENEKTNVGSPHFDDCVVMVNELEYFYSPHKCRFDPFFYQREAFYGSPYSFRPKTYGVEYRSPSNKWLEYPTLTEWLGDAFLTVAKKTLEDDPIKNGRFRRSQQSLEKDYNLKEFPRNLRSSQWDKNS